MAGLLVLRCCRRRLAPHTGHLFRPAPSSCMDLQASADTAWFTRELPAY